MGKPETLQAGKWTECERFPKYVKKTESFSVSNNKGGMAMFWEMMNQHLSIPQYLEFFLRILAACGCGAIIGIERSRRLKEAGLRTHVLVCCTAALIIVVSKYGFADLTGAEATRDLGVRGADPSRIAAQVVSGISFLCAGVIFKQGSMVKGLTTAAGLWATAGIGLALGAGMYQLGVFTTILVLVLQIFMHKLPIHNDQYHNNHIEVTVADDDEFRKALSRQITKWQAQVIESSIAHNQDGTTSYSLEVKMNSNVKQEEIFAFLEQNSSISFFRQTNSNWCARKQYMNAQMRQMQRATEKLGDYMEKNGRYSVALEYLWNEKARKALCHKAFRVSLGIFGPKIGRSISFLSQIATKK